MHLDKSLQYTLTGMLFCLAGSIGVYLLTGTTVYLLIGVAFIILACSVVVGIADSRLEEVEENVTIIEEVEEWYLPL